MKGRQFWYILATLGALLLVVLAGCGGVNDVTGPVAESNNQMTTTQEMDAAVAAQEKYSEEWLANDEIVGTAIGRSDTGRLAIMVLGRSDRAAVSRIVPQQVDGVPVEVRVTGPLVSIDNIPTGPQTSTENLAMAVEGIGPMSRYTRPVPIGVSTGNVGECSSGTIGVRVRRGAKTFALSNNHIYALENQAEFGSAVVQPGLYDTGCSVRLADTLGILTAYIPIRFDGSVNLIDAAIARTTRASLGTATPADGYGVPKSRVVRAQIGLPVQKYGRTTALTFGTVTMVNAYVTVGYTSGTAVFLGQTIVETSVPFIGPGDSGSLLVTQEDASPVGLLFAGNQSGTYSIANPIQRVLGLLGVRIDGE